MPEKNIYYHQVISLLDQATTVINLPMINVIYLTKFMIQLGPNS